MLKFFKFKKMYTFNDYYRVSQVTVNTKLNSLSCLIPFEIYNSSVTCQVKCLELEITYLL